MSNSEENRYSDQESIIVQAKKEADAELELISLLSSSVNNHKFMEVLKKYGQNKGNIKSILNAAEGQKISVSGTCFDTDTKLCDIAWDENGKGSITDSICVSDFSKKKPVIVEEILKNVNAEMIPYLQLTDAEHKQMYIVYAITDEKRMRELILQTERNLTNEENIRLVTVSELKTIKSQYRGSVDLNHFEVDIKDIPKIITFAAGKGFPVAFEMRGDKADCIYLNDKAGKMFAEAAKKIMAAEMSLSKEEDGIEKALRIPMVLNEIQDWAREHKNHAENEQSDKLYVIFPYSDNYVEISHIKDNLCSAKAFNKHDVLVEQIDINFESTEKNYIQQNFCSLLNISEFPTMISEKEFSFNPEMRRLIAKESVPPANKDFDKRYVENLAETVLKANAVIGSVQVILEYDDLFDGGLMKGLTDFTLERKTDEERSLLIGCYGEETINGMQYAAISAIKKIGELGPQGKSILNHYLDACAKNECHIPAPAKYVEEIVPSNVALTNPNRDFDALNREMDRIASGERPRYEDLE